jgi:hypothetical protein
MLANIPLKEAEETLFGQKHSRRTFWEDMRRGLAAHKVKYAREIGRHRSWAAIKGMSLVKCGLNDDNEWHWVIYDGRTKTLYDPLRNEETRNWKADGRSRKVSSYLRILS